MQKEFKVAGFAPISPSARSIDMILSVNNSAGVTNWIASQPDRTALPPKPKEHEKQDTVQLSQEAQRAAEDRHHKGNR
jgi:hypothetical protein